LCFFPRKEQTNKRTNEFGHKVREFDQSMNYLREVFRREATVFHQKHTKSTPKVLNVWTMIRSDSFHIPSLLTLPNSSDSRPKIKRERIQRTSFRGLTNPSIWVLHRVKLLNAFAQQRLALGLQTTSCDGSALSNDGFTLSDDGSALSHDRSA
jgi:hypothetical protein